MRDEFKEFFEVHCPGKDPRVLSRLSRHLALQGWGMRLQSILDSKRILVIGAGGLGCSICLQLCGCVFENAGISVLDYDTVDETNLHRQIAFTEADIGRPKVDALVAICRQRNRWCKIDAIRGSFNETNAMTFFESFDVILDCTDNVNTRVLISDAWIRTSKTKLVVSASCVGWYGQLVTLSPGTTFCLRCVYGNPVNSKGCDRLGQCALQGVMGPVVGVVANLQLLAFINYLKNPHASNQLQLLDFSGPSMVSRMMTLEQSCDSCLGRSELVSSDPVLSDSGDDSRIEINASQFLTLLRGDDVRVVDVREKSHYDCSRIRSSVNFCASEYLHSGVDLRDVQEIANILSSKTTVVVCRRGIDSLSFTERVLSVWPDVKIVSLKGGLTGLGVDII